MSADLFGWFALGFVLGFTSGRFQMALKQWWADR